MALSRRDFLKYCGLSAAALGLSKFDLLRLEEALASTSANAPRVIWLQGSSCTGCSMSFLNFVNTAVGADPTDAADILLNHIDLIYHPNLMSAAGETAAAIAQQAASGYILAVEGGVPTAFGGRTCWAWSANGVDLTFKDAVNQLAPNASHILCIGTCASFGGIPAAGPNPTGIKGVKDLFTGQTNIINKIINIPGCPAHPDWTVYPIAQLLLGNSIPLDPSTLRPTAIYGASVHSTCPRNQLPPVNCLFMQGCRGPGAYANCPTNLWNNKVNWCVNANAPCYACTEPTFPGTIALNTMIYNHEGTTNLNPSGSACNSCHD